MFRKATRSRQMVQKEPDGMPQPQNKPAPDFIPATSSPDFIPADQGSGEPPAITPQQSESLHNLGQLGVGAAKGLLHTVTALPAMAGEKINSLLGNKQPESVTGREQQYAP